MYHSINANDTVFHYLFAVLEEIVNVIPALNDLVHLNVRHRTHEPRYTGYLQMQKAENILTALYLALYITGVTRLIFTETPSYCRSTHLVPELVSLIYTLRVGK